MVSFPEIHDSLFYEDYFILCILLAPEIMFHLERKKQKAALKTLQTLAVTQSHLLSAVFPNAH